MHLIIDKRYNAKPHSELRRQAIKYTIALITTPWRPAFLVNNVGHACPNSWLTLFQISNFLRHKLREKNPKKTILLVDKEFFIVRCGT